MEFSKNCRGRYQGSFNGSPFENNGIGRMGSNVAPDIDDGRFDFCRENRNLNDSVRGDSINNDRQFNCDCKCECRPDDSIAGDTTRNCNNVPCRQTLGVVPNLALAMAYVPDQQWCDIYDCGTAIEHGTIFRQLNKPFLAVRRYR